MMIHPDAEAMITRDPNRMGGVPCIRDTRIPVVSVLRAALEYAAVALERAMPATQKRPGVTGALSDFESPLISDFLCELAEFGEYWTLEFEMDHDGRIVRATWEAPS